MAQANAADEQLLCLLCEKPMASDRSRRSLTDCSHEFCLQCLCRELPVRKNHCPACHVVVKKVYQLVPNEIGAPAPASIKFCNATYVLQVSIWSVAEPSRVLAGLFDLEQARLIHHGKVLKKGDVWPGTVVQLFGTRTGTQRASGSFYGDLSPRLRDVAWLTRLQQIVCCPFTVIYDFFYSLFDSGDPSRQRGYVRVATADSVSSSRTSFHAPGQVSSPHTTDSV